MKNDCEYYIRIKTFHQYEQAAECQLQLYHAGLLTLIERDQKDYHLCTNRVKNLDDAVRAEYLFKSMGFPAILLS